MIVHLNPQYSIRNYSDCSFLIRKNGIIDSLIGRETPSVTLLPPYIGYIIAAIGEKELDESIESIGSHLDIDREILRNFINSLIENEFPLRLSTDKESFNFPKRVLIKGIRTIRYSQQNIVCDNCDIKEIRPVVPFSVNFMVTTKCVTNCCYCYAKRDLSKELSTGKVLSVIDECYKLGVVNLNLTGGDLFAREDWKLLLKRAREYNYFPFLSTKKTLSKSDIEFLKSIGITDIQFSLDSVNPTLLNKIIASDSNYIERLVEMLNACETIGIKLSIRSVLCSYNSSIKSFSELYKFLKKYSIIKDWVITPAFFSEHQSDYIKYAATKDAISTIGGFIAGCEKTFPIILSKMSPCGYKLKRCESVDEFVNKNQKCYANSFSMSILASGQCTVCEMLYENPEYVIGDISLESLFNIWNGEKALSIYSISQKTLSNITPCFHCKVFNLCRNKLAKRICYVDIAKMNKFPSKGMPDPRCPKAEDTDVVL
ncbi:MAG: radical SAM protein [Muribaculaceae bacterium]|nr:radical SAM protein [Muribaculaceae bacterium]